jgi:hypothetical protein
LVPQNPLSFGSPKSFGFLLVLLVLNLERWTHGVRNDRAQVKDADWVPGIQGLGTVLEIGVAQNTTDSAWVSNLGPRIQVVLVTDYILSRKLTKIVRHWNLIG